MINWKGTVSSISPKVCRRVCGVTSSTWAIPLVGLAGISTSSWAQLGRRLFSGYGISTRLYHVSPSKLRFATLDSLNPVKMPVVAQDIHGPTPLHQGNVIGIDVINGQCDVEFKNSGIQALMGKLEARKADQWEKQIVNRVTTEVIGVLVGKDKDHLSHIQLRSPGLKLTPFNRSCQQLSRSSRRAVDSESSGGWLTERPIEQLLWWKHAAPGWYDILIWPFFLP